MSEVNHKHMKGVWGLPHCLFTVLAWLSGFVLFGIMLLVTAAVFYRYVLNQPILGDQEFVEVGMALTVMLAMPFATYKGAHIRVDIFDKLLGDWGRFLGDLFSRLVACFILFLLIKKTYAKALDAHEYEEVTNMIELPVWLIYGSITLGMGLYIFVLVLQLALQFRNGVKSYE